MLVAVQNVTEVSLERQKFAFRINLSLKIKTAYFFFFSSAVLMLYKHSQRPVLVSEEKLIGFLRK